WLAMIWNWFVARMARRVRGGLVLRVFELYRWYLRAADTVHAYHADTSRRCGTRRQGAAQARRNRRVPARDLRAAARAGAAEGARGVRPLPQARLHDRDRKLARTARRAHRVHHAAAADGGLGCVPGAAQHAMMRRRPGTAKRTEPVRSRICAAPLRAA